MLIKFQFARYSGGVCFSKSFKLKFSARPIATEEHQRNREVSDFSSVQTQYFRQKLKNGQKVRKLGYHNFSNNFRNFKRKAPIKRELNTKIFHPYYIFLK